MKRSGLDGRVVAITGGARGIGLATAKELLGRGAKIVIGDIDADLVVREAAALGAEALGVELDVTDPDSFEKFIAAAEERFGVVDVLINNAGIMPIGAFLQEPTSLAARALEINVGGALNGMKTVLPTMVRRGKGHIVNVASVAGKSPVPGGLTYAATKAAVVSMTESARVEFAGKGVHFTCVMPSFTNTDLIAGTQGTKLVKTVEPEDVAQAIRKALEKPRADVFVPRVLGPIVFTQPLMGRGLRDRVNHVLGADRVFLEFDASARKGYTDRIGRD
ncbi:MAG TPA: SDR family oxidoreductase [Nocardioidaceae bacterium]|nr:SDR family oxidoreductase [Nocardioidaceae bacterium]